MALWNASSTFVSVSAVNERPGILLVGLTMGLLLSQEIFRILGESDPGSQPLDSPLSLMVVGYLHV